MVKTATPPPPTLEKRFDLRPSPYLRFEMTSLRGGAASSSAQTRPRARGGLMAYLDSGAAAVAVGLTIGLHAKQTSIERRDDAHAQIE